MTFNNLLFTKDGPIALITVNRPPVNALNGETIEELGAALDEIEADDQVKSVVITGAGQYTFVAGADISQFTQLTPEQGLALMEKGQALYDRIELLGKPVIAAINGACLGGGNELAMACDLRIAAESARFGQPEINLGIIPGWGGTQRLPRLIGKTRALELLLTGDMVKAQDAFRYGLINKVVPDNELLAQAKNTARRLAMQPLVAMAAIKKVVRDGLAMPMEEALEAERRAFMEVFQTDDAAEGIRAFLEKRRPRFGVKRQQDQTA